MADPFTDFLRTLSGPRKCKCGAPVDHPGICDRCSEKADRRRSAEMFTAALGSIPEHYRLAKFGSAELTAFCGTGAPGIGRQAIDGLLAKIVPGIVLIGEKGVGKTSLACAMFREAIDRQHPLALRGRFVSAVELGVSRKDSPLGSRPWLLDDAIKASLLVLDELGKESDRGPIVEVIAARHDAERPTIVTTPWTQEELCNPQCGYDGGTCRRIFERSVILAMGARE